MKFVHIADTHFDMPFTVLNQNGLAEERRLDQRNSFQKMIQYIKENNIDCLFLAGDLYNHEYVRKSTIDFINQCFQTIPETKIYITPGNHDPYLTNSYYHQYEWNENVHIFTNMEKVNYSEKIDIYGYGFTDFYSSKVVLPMDLDTHKINVLVMHADLDGATKEAGDYNSILSSELRSTNFDYIALGHIHKANWQEGDKMVYPGSTIAGGFDELGKHGMVVGEINEETKELTIKFVPLDDKEFVEEMLDLSEIASTEELIEKINDLSIENNKYYKIILIGTKQIELSTSEILKYVIHTNIIKIKDKTSVEYDLKKIAKEQSLKGFFVKELLEQMTDENKEQILESIYIGLSLM